ncbi:MAG: alpha/beta hydrolase [Pseudomonadales bacterium]
MQTKHLLDPELHRLVELMPTTSFDAEMLPDFRKARAEEITLVEPDEWQITREQIQFKAEDGHEVRALLYQPKDSTNTRPGYLHIHGGGYIMGAPEGSDAQNAMLTAKLGIVILSVSYRLAPEHSIPAPLHDCYAGLAWLHQNAEQLAIDPTRIGIGGESAGGGLAAATAILARDRGEFAICHQQLTYPMLDNETGSSAAPGDPLVGEFIWDRERNQFGWAAYLGNAPAQAPQVPARVDDYAGLPPTWMFTAALDLFRDENIAYAQRLLEAGVATDLVLYAGACHGFQFLRGSALGKRFVADHRAALARGLGLALD